MLDFSGRNDQYAPFDDPDIRKDLGLSNLDWDKTKLYPNVSTALAMRVLEIKPIEQHPLVTSLQLSAAEVPRNSYFDQRWVDFRKEFWFEALALAAGSEECLPPILLFSLLCDEPDLMGLLLINAGVFVDIEAERLVINIQHKNNPLSTFLTQNLLNSESRKFVQLTREQFPKSLEEAPFLSHQWLHPQFASGRERSYDFWGLQAMHHENDFGNRLLKRCSKHPASMWFEWATVRRGTIKLRDLELTRLLAMSLLCLPALLLWKSRFSGSTEIRTTPDALVKLLEIFLAWSDPDAFRTVDWPSKLGQLGIQVEGVEFIGNRLLVDRRLRGDQLAALRLVVPPDWLTTPFHLDDSPLDSVRSLLDIETLV